MRYSFLSTKKENNIEQAQEVPKYIGQYLGMANAFPPECI